MRGSLVCAIATMLFATGCATTTTQMAPVSREEERAEEAIQRQVVLTELRKAQARLDDVSYPMLVSAVPLCGDKTRPRIGIQLGILNSYKDDWVEAARTALQLTDTLSITNVTAGSPAERAGLAVGDRILAVDGTAVPSGDKALETASKLLATPSGEHRITIVRQGVQSDVTVAPQLTCSFNTVVTVEGDINAF